MGGGKEGGKETLTRGAGGLVVAVERNTFTLTGLFMVGGIIFSLGICSEGLEVFVWGGMFLRVMFID